jgi:hypothetical protein
LQSCVLILTKKGLAIFWSIFFVISSGHPDKDKTSTYAEETFVTISSLLFNQAEKVAAGFAANAKKLSDKAKRMVSTSPSFLTSKRKFLH